MNVAPAENRTPGGGAWSRQHWLALVALVLALHVGLIFAFGRRHPPTPRAVTNVPALGLAGSGEWLALNDPTLFALPHREDFVGPALEPQRLEFHQRDWSERPRWLPLPADALGVVFSQFMQTNRFANARLELKSPPRWSVPPGIQPAPAQNSTLQIQGGLARRPLFNPPKLPSWPDTDLIAPSMVQVLVDAAGNIVSAVLLPSDNLAGADVIHDPAADQYALAFARVAHFAPLPDVNVNVTANPASHLTFGRLIFNWHTVPPAATNAPTATP
jgi:hypothetical protein